MTVFINVGRIVREVRLIKTTSHQSPFDEQGLTALQQLISEGEKTAGLLLKAKHKKALTQQGLLAHSLT